MPGGRLVEFMGRALEQAAAAIDQGEVPVGALVVGAEGEVLAATHNSPIANCDPTAHAEVLALRAAGEKLGNYRLSGCTLYVTLEPCAMCVGAIVHARIGRLVYGATDPKGGAVESCVKLLDSPHWNHTVAVTGGVLAEESAALLRRFFAMRREGSQAAKSGG